MDLEESGSDVIGRTGWGDDMDGCGGWGNRKCERRIREGGAIIVDRVWWDPLIIPECCRGFPDL